MILDANANVGPTVYSDFEFEPTIERLRSAMADNGIDEAVVAPLKPPSLDFEQANARLAARLREEESLYGIARVDPRLDGAAAAAERALAEYNLHGLKLHPWEESFSITDPCVPPVLDVARSHDVPVWIHAGYPVASHALSIREVATEHADIPLILTHGAQLDISGLSLTDALLLAGETENTYFELSGVYRRDLVEDLVSEVGAGRVVFGTNAPYFHPGVEKSRITTADVPDEDGTRVLGETAAELL